LRTGIDPAGRYDSHVLNYLSNVIMSSMRVPASRTNYAITKDDELNVARQLWQACVAGARQGMQLFGLPTGISDIENVELVFKDGVGFDSKQLIDAVKGQVGIR
jgi:hypothetical protein